MKFLTRDQILAADDITFRDVEVPEWGGLVRVRSLCGTDRARLLAMLPDEKERRADEWVERLVVACACDENGEALFSADDIAELKKKNANAINRIFEAADDLNIFSEASRQRAKGESEPTRN